MMFPIKVGMTPKLGHFSSWCGSKQLLVRMDQINSDSPKSLSDEEKLRLKSQDTRLVPEFKAQSLELEAKKHWDLFYKRNGTRFFKDRHWTTREFVELIENGPQRRTLLEVGCGVGNFVFPLMEDGLNFHILACDLSPRAVEMVQSNPMYDSAKIKAFQSDITTKDIFTQVEASSVDIVTLIFVLSAIHPSKFVSTLKTIWELLKPGGVLLFRDYGLYDMAQLRFKPGHKIGENFYMRQDGTRSFYFSTEYLDEMFKQSGYETISNSYIHRRTINKKENVDVPRIFVQAKVLKPK